MQAGSPLKLVFPPMSPTDGSAAAPDVRDLGNLGASIVRLASAAASMHVRMAADEDPADQAARLRQLVRSRMGLGLTLNRGDER